MQFSANPPNPKVRVFKLWYEPRRRKAVLAMQILVQVAKEEGVFDDDNTNPSTVNWKKFADLDAHLERKYGREKANEYKIDELMSFAWMFGYNNQSEAAQQVALVTGPKKL